MPHMLATGDDDGVIKVCTYRDHNRQSSDLNVWHRNSSGILENLKCFGNTNIILTLSPTSFG